ncbi:MAG: putative rane protein [Candidatus Krumholzibacteriota bacterium]|nr:putative rane protein [Candidatus Krumholzibacteriota bacterium]
MDVLRGFAILGILAVNIQSFAMPDATLFNPTAYGDLTGTNRWVWYVTHILFEQKFMTIFSMLFGAGILLMTGRAEARGIPSAPLHRRRMAVLLGFGLAHAYLVWTGDILVGYALCGLLVHRFRHREPRSLVGWGIGLVAAASVLSLIFGWSMAYWPPETIEELTRSVSPTSAAVDETLSAYRGGYLSELVHRAPRSFQSQTFVFLIWTFWRASGLMLIGMALFKQGVFSAARSTRFYTGLLVAAAAAGIPAAIYGTWRNFGAQWDVRYSFFIGSQYNYWGSILVSLGWIALVMLACRHEVARGFTARLSAVGRMALSNYLAQSLVCTTIFYGRGLGLYGGVDRVGQALIVAGIWMLQLALSPWWLARFRFGPCEWAWRSLTYGRPQPMRRS